MRFKPLALSITTSLLLTSCAHKGINPVDPFEPFNRKVHRFNMALDTVVLKPAAIIYTSLVPYRLRKSVDNAYSNIDMIPTVANDLLQAEGKWAIKDTWRFFINSTLGIGGLLDVAQTFGLPPHANDLGLTLAKWGDTKSPYLVIPFLGPSTLRDGTGMLFQFALYSPYVYLDNNAVMYSLLGLRYVDLRSQFLDSERLMDEALDKYAFLRDAYLQHRNYLITGTKPDDGSTFVEEVSDEKAGTDYVDE